MEEIICPACGMVIARCECEDLRRRLEAARREVHEIIRKALAGYEDAYKFTDTNGNKYVQWGRVSKDIDIAFDKALGNVTE